MKSFLVFLAVAVSISIVLSCKVGGNTKNIICKIDRRTNMCRKVEEPCMSFRILNYCDLTERVNMRNCSEEVGVSVPCRNFDTKPWVCGTNCTPIDKLKRFAPIK